MGSIDIPPFLRQKMKEKIQNGKQQPESENIPPFLKKKEETAETTGEDLKTGTEETSQSKLPSPFTYQRQITRTEPISANLKPEHQPLALATEAYQKKQLTPQDIAVLQNTDFGKEKGLHNLTNDNAKNVYADLFNKPDIQDVNDHVSEILQAYPINLNTPEGKRLQNAFATGDANEIMTYKDAVVDNLKKQIPTSKPAGGVSGAYGAETTLTPEEEKKKAGIESEINKINQVFTDYSDNIAAEKYLKSAGEPGAQLTDTEIKLLGANKEKRTIDKNSFQQRQLLASQNNKKYLEGLDKIKNNPDLSEGLKEYASKKYAQNYIATENIDYEREKTGLSMILNNLSMKYNDLAKKVITTNPELKDEADKLYDQIQAYQQKYNAIDDKDEYGDVRVSKTARLIGDKFVDKYGSMTPVTGKRIGEIASEIDKENPGYLDKYGKDISFLEENPEMIPKGGFIGGVKSGLYNIGKDVGTGFGFFGGDKTEKAAREISDQTKTNIKGTGYTEPTKIIFDNEDKAYKEIPNEDYGKINWNSSMRFLGQSAPGLAEFILLDKGLGKAAQLVGKIGVEGLLKIGTTASELNKVGITADELAAARQALSIGENTKNSLGLFGALTLTGHEQNRKIADELIDDNSTTGEAKKTLLANLLNLSSFAAFKMAGISPSAAIEKALQKSVSQDALKLFEENGWNVAEDKAQNFFKDTVLPKLKSVLGVAGNNILQGAKLGEAMTIDANTRGLISNIVNPEKGTLPSLKDDAKIFANQIILMTAAGLPQMITSGFSPTNKDVLYDAGLTAPEHIFRINEMLKDGEIDQKRANEMISMVNTMAEEVSKVQGMTNDKGLPLTVKQKRDIAVEGFRKRAAEKLGETNDAISQEKIFNESDKTIKEALATNQFEPADEHPLVKIINGENPKEEQNKSLSLSQIENDAKDITTGKAVFERLSPAEERGRAESGTANVEATILLDRLQKSGSEDSTTPEGQEKILENFAKEKNIWVNDTEKEYGKPHASGAEAYVWYNEGDKTVTKAINTFHHENPQEVLDRIAVHNSLFPETKLEVIGFGKSPNGDFNVLVKQPLIIAERGATKEEVSDHMKKLGFEDIGDNAYRNNTTIIEDLHPGNVLVDKENNLHFIDPIIRLNTPEQGYGGEREMGSGNVSIQSSNIKNKENGNKEKSSQEGSQESGQKTNEKSEGQGLRQDVNETGAAETPDTGTAPLPDSKEIFKALKKKSEAGREIALDKIKGIPKEKIELARKIHDNFDDIVRQLEEKKLIEKICP